MNRRKRLAGHGRSRHDWTRCKCGAEGQWEWLFLPDRWPWARAYCRLCGRRKNGGMGELA